MFDIIRVIGQVGAIVIIWSFALAAMSLCVSVMKDHWK
jgi:hypothetical protein